MTRLLNVEFLRRVAAREKDIEEPVLRDSMHDVRDMRQISRFMEKILWTEIKVLGSAAQISKGICKGHKTPQAKRLREMAGRCKSFSSKLRHPSSSVQPSK
jgi:hypothetical protein